LKISDLESKIKKRIAFLEEQLSALRVGALNLGNIGILRISVYGREMSLREVASLTLNGPSEIIVSFWDKSILKDAEKNLREIKNSGFSVIADGDLLRLKASELTTERREALVKEISQLKEETKVAVRLLRQDQMRSLDEMEERGEIAEDERFRKRDQVDKIIKEANSQIDQIASMKQEQVRG